MLTNVMETSQEPVVLAVATHDIGEYVRHYPRGKKLVCFNAVTFDWLIVPISICIVDHLSFNTMTCHISDLSDQLILVSISHYKLVLGL